MKRIAFNSIVPSGTATHLLALRQLKSQLLAEGLGQDLETAMPLFTTDQPAAAVAQALLEQSYDIYAFSVYLWNVSKIAEVCRLIKREHPRGLILLGGPQATFTAPELMTDGPFDLLVRGPGETVLPKILRQELGGARNWHALPNLVFQENGRLCQTEVNHDLEIAPAPYQLEVSDGTSELFFYMTSRGCPFSCRYCTWSATTKRRLTLLPREKLSRELRAIFELPHLRVLYLGDSDLFINREHGLWVLDQIHQLNGQRRRQGWPESAVSFEANPEFIDGEIAEQIARLPLRGNTIACGLQTIDEVVNNRHLNRRFNRSRYLANLKQLHALAGRRISTEIIYGLPGDSLQGYKNTIDFILCELGLEHFVSYRFNVLPGSYFWDHAADYDLVYEPQPPHRIIRSGTWSEGDIIAAQRIAFFMLMFNTLFRGLTRSINKKFAGQRLAIYQRIMDYLDQRYPEFISQFFTLFQRDDELDFMVHLNQCLVERRYVGVRYAMIRDAQRLVAEIED